MKYTYSNILRFILLLSFLSLVACDSDDDDDDEAAILASQVAIINAIPDAPGLILSLEDELSNETSFGQSSSSFAKDVFQSYTVDVLYATPDSVLEFLVEDFAVDVGQSREIYILLTGTMASPTITIIDNPVFELETDDDGNIIATSEVLVQFVNAAMDEVSLDIYFSEFADPISLLAPAASLAAGGITEQISYTEDDDYRVRITEQGLDTVLYDSGEVNLLSARNQIYLVLDYFGPGDERVKVVSIASRVTSQLVNESLDSDLRIANFMAGQPLVNGYLGDVSGVPSYNNIAFGEYSDYLTLEAETYDINITPSTNNLSFLYEQTQTLVAGESRTLFLAGDLSTDQGISARYIIESDRIIATEIQLNFVHASASAGQIDLYILPPGQPFSDANPVVGGADLLSNLVVPLEIGSFDLVATLSDSGTVIAGPMRIVVEPGVLSLVLSEAPSGGAPYALLLRKEGVGN